jgi:hypothetical protein
MPDCLVEAVGLVAGMPVQGVADRLLQEGVRCLPRSVGGGPEGGVRGGREGDVEQDLAACVWVVRGDDVEGQSPAYLTA